MSHILSLLVMLIPVIGIMSGLFVSLFVTLFLGCCLYKLRNKLSINLHKFRLEIYFFIWLLFSTFWSINISVSLLTFFKVFTISCLGILIQQNIHKINQISKIEKALIASVIIAFCIFFIEFLTEGVISRMFRSMIQSEKHQRFYLFQLDRGCAFISLASWLVIAILIKKNKPFYATLLYLIILFMFFVSDSLSSFIAFLIGGCVSLSARYCQFIRNPFFACSCLTIVFIYMISFASLIDANTISKQNNFLPDSAKHRLFIWQYVTKHSMQRIVSGYGFSSSRNFKIAKEDFIYYDGNELLPAAEARTQPDNSIILSPLPLHPHNNILHILLEGGLVGLILYLTICCRLLLFIGKNYNSKNLITVKIISVSYACFASYYFISMTSFSMWQSWWVCTGIWIIIMFSWMFRKQIYS